MDVLIAVAIVMLLVFLSLQVIVLWQREQIRLEERVALRLVLEQLKGDTRTFMTVQHRQYHVVSTEKQICVKWEQGCVCSDR